ncbi:MULTISPECIES: THUMP domain-containing class I SAM-dependent RNA methyltransferase [unclassified Sedimentibacter]|uniref:THUMP domain-containing class I SAM-dependent RNA methyltransferase n=1 Tax=unclassified Sedimentibacter TaxID=2649220 RepID=UPI0027E13587|nr:class I SAM-dependent RNA methyltransferase [Sedimentibacter sp. MB35-C1]WMJ78675.1 class I SAM-dependent RNA methyltransferase [Sedimentibacter sp. MB35-C1]
MEKIRLAAISAFGLEAIVKRELHDLGYDDVVTDNGWMYFDAEIDDIPRTNINLRCADRVMLVMGQFDVYTFEELFDKTYELPWEKWISEEGKFTVKGKSVKSKLYSTPDCQSIVKKAVSKKLCQEYGREWMPETGAEFTIQISIHKDVATLTIDTTGAREGLFKRGYREKSTMAPLKETMAAALVKLSYWNKDRVLYDPMCGSGTIAIEAAMIGRNIAPGLNRKFASQGWPVVKEEYWKNAKVEARRKIDLDSDIKIFASDISKKAIEIAKENAIEAGVDDCIDFFVKDVTRIREPMCPNGILITNPPYGERIGETEEIHKIHKKLGQVFGKDKTWSTYVITSVDSFERDFGRKADRKRKLFNGDVRVDYYQYYGKKPERNND